MPTLPADIRFRRGDGDKKYKATWTDAVSGRTRTVQFGARGYEHYRDSVPRAKGGGLWSKWDHLDRARRANYRARHAGMRCADGKRCIDKKYSPAWFSYHFLW